MGVAYEVCLHFLQAVVQDRVFSDAERTRGSRPLDEGQRRQLETSQRVDTRSPALTRISGKGGWRADGAYAVFTNVTLLDHLLSVVRGALQFAEMDLTGRGSRPPEELRRRLAAVAAVAFLHDSDKMLDLSRSATRGGALDAAAIGGLMDRFGITAFLEGYGVPLSATQMLELINGVEVTRTEGLVRLPREHWHDRMYVRLADRVDGAFLQTQPTETRPHFGVDGALREIAGFSGLDTGAVQLGGEGWRVVELRDPHTPFLLDAFQAGLSAICLDHHGIPPLIELHHDGRLLVVLPRRDSDALIAQALGRVTGDLGARIRVATNARGKVDLLDAPGDLEDLRASVAAMQAREREGVLRAGIDALREHGAEIDALLRPVDFLPRTPDLASYAGRLVPLWTGTATFEDHLAETHRNAVLVSATLSCTDPPARLNIPGADQREAELRALLNDTGALTAWPDWLDAVSVDTRRALLAAYAAAAAQQNDALMEQLLGPDGLVALWLEGREDRPGLAAAIDHAGVRLRAAVEAHYGALLAGQFIATDEAAEGRCHFTNTPVPRTARIDGKTGLYGVNVSAFSGRDGRPESFRSSASETLVSPIAEAEHKLRRLQYERSGRSAGGRRVPVTVTSPTTAGLFGALPFGNDADPAEFALADLLRAKIEPGKLTYPDAEAALRRTRVARFEELPDRMIGSGTEPGQIAFTAMVFEAALRTGRPVHVFRGLPRERPEFVVFDTLSQPLVSLLEGDAFRLEQIPHCLQLLRGVEAVAEATGFGLELALRLCEPATRFGAACDALARADRRIATSSQDLALRKIQSFSLNLLENHAVSSPSDTAILSFAEAMARVQRKPISSDGANMAELGLRTALTTVEALERMRQTGTESLVAGIAGELEKVMTRGGLRVRAELRGGQSFETVVEAAARVFVTDVWYGAFDATLPSSRDRRVALAVYRHGFQSASSRLYARNGIPATEDSEQAA
ncbi:hypothetical protein [Roseomonas marmotae]|uniref:CRISPR-associated endonuclease Cas3 n=1 Tax=Roseomonas marmotae TaxID=2768161 RepID=A0ABS3KJD9_9PROT|nr:hypothetical protein [Roseomonas marmotae]MBO1077090.1 hypothetical protein [Roseomonas marmotae]